MRFCRPLLFLIVLLPLSLKALPQLPGLSSSQSAAATTPAKQEPAIPPDPLGRETPRGTLVGFIKAAQDERYNLAVQYFQPPPSRRH